MTKTSALPTEKPVPRRRWLVVIGSFLFLCTASLIGWWVYDGLTFRPTGIVVYECQHGDGQEPFYRDICVFQFSDKRSSVLINLNARLGSPTWSPDGGQLAFIHTNGSNSAIMIYDYSLKTVETLWQTDFLTQDYISLLAWLPNDKHILFQGAINNKVGLYFLDQSQLKPTPKLLVPTSHSTLNDPVFSNADARIYYYDDSQLFSIDLNGSDKQFLNIECGDPAFAPSGQRLACSGVNEAVQYELPTWERLSIKHVFLPLSEAAEPTWSTNSQYIVYVQTHLPNFLDHNGELWIMNADGSHPVKLTNGPADRNPAWRPQP